MSFTFYQINTIILFITTMPKTCQRKEKSLNKLIYNRLIISLQLLHLRPHPSKMKGFPIKTARKSLTFLYRFSLFYYFCRYTHKIKTA